MQSSILRGTGIETDLLGKDISRQANQLTAIAMCQHCGLVPEGDVEQAVTFWFMQDYCGKLLYRWHDVGEPSSDTSEELYEALREGMLRYMNDLSLPVIVID